MFHLSFPFLIFLSISLTITKINSSPCELIVKDSPANNRANTIIDNSASQLIDDENSDDYLEQYLATSQLNLPSDLPPLYSLYHQIKSFDSNDRRAKRPSWAAVGKRAFSIKSKRPSWAQVG